MHALGDNSPQSGISEGLLSKGTDSFVIGLLPCLDARGLLLLAQEADSLPDHYNKEHVPAGRRLTIH